MQVQYRERLKDSAYRSGAISDGIDQQLDLASTATYGNDHTEAWHHLGCADGIIECAELFGEIDLKRFKNRRHSLANVLLASDGQPIHGTRYI